VAGFGMTSDAGDIVAPNAEGAARAMRAALADAGMAATEVGYINAHGTGTLAHDRAEAAAIRDVFAAPPPVSSTKAMHGHAIGATGALEALACIMSLTEGVLPPTIGFEAPDPDCALDVVPNVARPVRVGAALSNAFAFGGLNAVLAFRQA
jgi:nodulation protein E